MINEKDSCLDLGAYQSDEIDERNMQIAASNNEFYEDLTAEKERCAVEYETREQRLAAC